VTALWETHHQSSVITQHVMPNIKKEHIHPKTTVQQVQQRLVEMSSFASQFLYTKSII